jgi:hypothetical protein
VASPETVNAAPALAFAGDEAVEADTLTSVVALIAVLAGALVILLFPGVGSDTWS